MNKPLENVALVIIGRNEGARLVACLASVQGRFSQIVYVILAQTMTVLRRQKRQG